MNVCIDLIFANILYCSLCSYHCFCLWFVLMTLCWTELINKLNFLEDEDQEPPPVMGNPFDEPDGDLHPNHLNPFGDPDEDGMFNSVCM